MMKVTENFNSVTANCCCIRCWKETNYRLIVANINEFYSFFFYSHWFYGTLEKRIMGVTNSLRQSLLATKQVRIHNRISRECWAGALMEVR